MECYLISPEAKDLKELRLMPFVAYFYIRHVDEIDYQPFQVIGTDVNDLNFKLSKVVKLKT